MQNTYDIPTYPELGNIYPGDYYEALPYDEFIDKNQEASRRKKGFRYSRFWRKTRKRSFKYRSFLKSCSQHVRKQEAV